jgi:hypothetical protein
MRLRHVQNGHTYSPPHFSGSFLLPFAWWIKFLAEWSNQLLISYPELVPAAITCTLPHRRQYISKAKKSNELNGVQDSSIFCMF